MRPACPTEVLTDLCLSSIAHFVAWRGAHSGGAAMIAALKFFGSLPLMPKQINFMSFLHAGWPLFLLRALEAPGGAGRAFPGSSKLNSIIH